jgi:transcription termination factor Rho
MPVLDRSALVDSPLADLHAIASELSIDGFRRLRRPELIDAILIKQGNEDVAPVAEDGDAPTGTEEETPTRSRRGRRGGRGRSSARKEDDAETETETPAETEAPAEAVAEVGDSEEEAAPKPRRSRSRSRVTKEEEPEAAAPEEAPEKPARSRSRSRAAKEDKPETVTAAVAEDTKSDAPDGTPAAEETVDGVVELLANGSGFVRVAGPDPSDDDVYISSAQVKRCELVSGDTITGPKRAPRRSERFASLIRVETINGRPASELADSVRFDDLPAALPSVRLKVGSEDPTLKAIEWLTPFGRGSRVTITGASRAGKTEALKRLAVAFAESEDLTVSVALVGVRPEEISEWTSAAAGVPAPAAALSFAASEDVQSGAVEPVVDQARRLAARGAHAVVLIDTLDGLHPQAARRVMASARNLVDGGSVTVIATSTEPIGGETTVIALDVALTSVGRFPALDLVASGTLRPELLVGEAGAEAIARTRAEVSEEDED